MFFLAVHIRHNYKVNMNFQLSLNNCFRKDMYTHIRCEALRCNLELVICTYKLLFSYKTALKNQGRSGVQVIWL